VLVGVGPHAFEYRLAHLVAPARVLYRDPVAFSPRDEYAAALFPSLDFLNQLAEVALIVEGLGAIAVEVVHEIHERTGVERIGVPEQVPGAQVGEAESLRIFEIRAEAVETDLAHAGRRLQMAEEGQGPQAVRVVLDDFAGKAEQQIPVHEYPVLPALFQKLHALEAAGTLLHQLQDVSVHALDP